MLCFSTAILLAAVLLLTSVSGRTEVELYEELISKHEPSVRPRLVTSEPVDVELTFELYQLKELVYSATCLSVLCYIMSLLKWSYLKEHLTDLKYLFTVTWCLFV